MNASESSGITVYWRPRCPYCKRLLGDLGQLGLPFQKVNIWENADAAATVRSVAGGNETVPTVFVGGEGLVNPRAREVVELARDRAPESVAELDDDAVARVANGRWWSGLPLAGVIAAIWFLLALRNPASTYHLAPLVIAASWPIGRRARSGRRLPARLAATTAGGAAALAAVTTAAIVAVGAASGPALPGFGSIAVEFVVLGLIGALVGGVAAALGTRKRP